MAVPVITNLPTPPSRRRPQTFSNEADAWNAAFPQWTEETNTLGNYLEQRAVDTENAATNAESSEALAEQWAISTTAVSGGLKGARGYAQDASSSASSAATDATRAESAVATLPSGTIADAIIAPDKAWSSQKINTLLTLDARTTFKSDFATDEHFLDDGTRTFAPAEYVWDVERASPKYALTANGKYREVPVDTLAREWNPEIGEYAALIEGSATNNAFPSFGFSLSGGTAVTESTTDIGPGFLHEYIETADSNNRFSVLGSGLSGDQTAYAHAQAIPGSAKRYVQIRGTSPNEGALFDINLGVVTAVSGSVEAHIDHIGNGVYKCTATFLNASGSTVVVGMTSNISTAGGLYNGDGVSGVRLGLIGIVGGKKAGSPIITTDAPVTRAADNISRELGAEFNASEGTVVVEFDDVTLRSGGVTAQVFGLFDQADNTPRLIVECLPTVSLRSAGAIALPSTLPFGGAYSGGRGVVGFSWDASGYRLAFNGQVNESNTPIEGIDLLSRIAPLFGYGNPINGSNGVCSLLTHSPRALTAAQLQELTTL